MVAEYLNVRTYIWTWTKWRRINRGEKRQETEEEKKATLNYNTRLTSFHKYSIMTRVVLMLMMTMTTMLFVMLLTFNGLTCNCHSFWFYIQSTCLNCFIALSTILMIFFVFFLGFCLWICFNFDILLGLFCFLSLCYKTIRKKMHSNHFWTASVFLKAFFVFVCVFFSFVVKLLSFSVVR